MKRWLPAALLAVAFPAIPADDATTLAARAEAILDHWEGDPKQLEEAGRAIDEAIKLGPETTHLKGLKGRHILAVGTTEEGIRPSALRAASGMLMRASFEKPTDVRTVAFLVPVRIAYKQDDTYKMLKMAEAVDANDPWLHWAWAKHHEFHNDYPAKIASLEKAVALGLPNPVELRRAYDELIPRYVQLGKRAELEEAYAQRVKLDPRDPWLRDDMAWNLMVWFGDFSAGEKYAREAASLRDDVQARQMISLSLYGQWAVAARDGLGADVIQARFRAAQEYDPGGRGLPGCIANVGKVRFVYERLVQKDITVERMTRC